MIEAAVRRRLDGVVGSQYVFDDPATRRVLSSDYSWISPILRRELEGAMADLIVCPASATEAASVLAIAFDAGVPVTARGKGTGNYGQAVPLAAGLVLDMSRLTRVYDVAGGWLTAGAGTRFVQLDTEARRTGQELTIFPSTVWSSLGGFLAGGAGGTGSIEHGFVWDGYVGRLQVAPCVADAEPVWVDNAADVAPFLHAYGTTGLVTAATIRLVPARRWTAMFASFALWADALGAAWELINREPLPRSLSVDEPALVGLFPPDQAMPPGQVSLRAIVEHGDADEAGRIVTAAGGRVEAGRDHGTRQMVSLSYNHATLRAVRARPELCHLQVGGPALAERAEDVRACLPGAMLHVDCQRHGDQPWFGGLLLSEFHSRDTLDTGIAALEELGVVVLDPHTYQLGAHTDLAPLRAKASAFDPKSLLNPGKLPAAAPLVR